MQRLGDERGGGGLEAVRVEPKAGGGGPGAARPLGRGSVRAGPLAVESSPAGGERQEGPGAGDGVGSTGIGRVAAWSAEAGNRGHTWSCAVAALVYQSCTCKGGNRTAPDTCYCLLRLPAVLKCGLCAHRRPPPRPRPDQPAG